MKSLGDREQFLDTVAARLTDGIPENHLRPVEADPAPAPISYAGLDPDRDRVAQFTAALRLLTGEVLDASNGAAETLRRFVTGRAVNSAVVSRDPECAGLDLVLADLGVTLVDRDDLDAVAEVDLGVTGAAWGIALTGSLVVDSTRAGGRTASLVPPTHLAFLRRDRLLDDPGDLLRHLGTRLPDGLPSNLVFITGPSKSADIELQLTIGVHGPRELIVALL